MLSFSSPPCYTLPAFSSKIPALVPAAKDLRIEIMNSFLCLGIWVMSKLCSYVPLFTLFALSYSTKTGLFCKNTLLTTFSVLSIVFKMIIWNAPDSKQLDTMNVEKIMNSLFFCWTHFHCSEEMKDKQNLEKDFSNHCVIAPNSLTITAQSSIRTTCYSI